MLAASLLFTLMAAFSKIGAEHLGIFELVFWRSIFGTTIIGLWALHSGFSIQTAFFKAHLKRSFLGTFALTIWFFSIAYLPLGTAMTLNYTSPLYIAAFTSLTAMYRRTPLNWGLLLSVLAGFAGVMLVLQPDIRSGDEFPALVGLASGLFAALAYRQVKELTVMKEPDWRIVFYFTLFGSIWGLGGQLALGGFSSLSFNNVVALFGMGITGTMAQLCMTKAWGKGNMLLTSTLQFSAIVFAAILGFFLFDEPFTTPGIIGISVIMTAGIVATMITRRQSQR